ncbi:LOW QUALITY PROTEIN: cytoplasmic tRNA 2-thiolation protein 2-like [Sinocyclocheilus grahami]|uniref:LOW QUALITY PROTEIN: cytoplasmic tRNA 2-thiolation protein 2-like n=1 Tax=Sinocyclocheilus grahami TaxID=75366 RepID=UPI0007AC997A|nr:PREDICTED: LOW QUALITY PROTEIN: cytoplasmic tRNA 2-thiolation protein 2-like [Sinocyclocheilus grahami]
MCQAEEEYNGLECKQEKIPVPTSCFKEYFIHKLRAMLGNNRVIFPHEKVLLAVSGGTASYSMLSQVQEFICVEDSAYSPEHKLAVERLFSSLKILIAKEDMLQTLRQHLILHIARENGYSKVMMGDSCSRLAVKLLSNITLGRRAALASDTGFSDHRYGDVVIVRPMRDYSFKEITYYSRMFNVPSVFISGLDTKTHDKASIQRLTESFVTNLQADFPSTVSTIYRTSEKLNTSVMSPQSQTAEAASKCLLCLCALDTKAGKASAFNATLVSEQLSQIELQDPSVEAPARSAEEGQGCGSSNRLPSHQDLKTLLCYSCRLTIKDMGATDTLPPYIITEAEKQQKRWEMLLRNLNE